MCRSLKRRTETRTIKVHKWLVAICFGLAICLLPPRPDLRASETNEDVLDSPLTVSQVVSRMVEMNNRRSEAIQNYTSLRSYHVELHGLIHIHANMEVKMIYQRSGKKDFVILSESGSAFMCNHVLKRLIKAENDASRQGERRQVSITPRNYNFKLAGYKQNAQGKFYVLDVTPKVKRKFLFKGRIWVDARNFAMVRIEGQPAKTLSWWTPKVNFVYQYKKVGEFWFPALNRTVTHVRLLGNSLLTIQYKDYDLTQVRNVNPYTPVRLILSDLMQHSALIPPSPEH